MILPSIGFNFAKYMRIIPTWSFLLFLVVLISCERAINFEPKDANPKIVIEGIIENDQYPIVRITNSLNFFDEISLGDASDFFIHNANVEISNGESTYILVEKSVSIGDGASLYYYTVDSSDLNAVFKGELDKQYELSIEIGGQTYTSTTTIPPLNKSITALLYEEYIDKDDPGKIALYGEYYDPPGLGNYTRYFTQVAGGAFLPGLNSVFDDQVVDGKTYRLQIDQGADRNTEIDFDEYAYFRRGDSITVKYCNIDKSTYDFWRTMEYGYQSIGNPFSAPTRVIGNISNGALGYFGGYAVQYISITLPE